MSLVDIFTMTVPYTYTCDSILDTSNQRVMADGDCTTYETCMVAAGMVDDDTDDGRMLVLFRWQLSGPRRRDLPGGRLPHSSNSPLRWWKTRTLFREGASSFQVSFTLSKQ